MMDTVVLPPELEKFVAEAVATGDFRDPTDVIAAGVRLLQEQRSARAAFVRSLEEAEAEADRDGWLSLDEVMAEAEVVIAGMSNAG